MIAANSAKGGSGGTFAGGYPTGGTSTSTHTGSSGNSHGGVIGTFVSSAKEASSDSFGSDNVSNAMKYAQSVSDAINQFNIDQTKMVNDFNAKEAQKNRDWQERMARNAHQYEVDDLIKAGLNPVLSAGGQGAFVGSGAVASGQKAVADDTMSRVALSLLNSSMNSAGNIAAAAASAGDKKTTNETLQTWSKFAGPIAHIAGILLKGALFG